MLPPWTRLVQLAPAWAADFGGKTLDINGTRYYHYLFHINRKDVVQVAVEKLKAQVRVCGRGQGAASASCLYACAGEA